MFELHSQECHVQLFKNIHAVSLLPIRALIPAACTRDIIKFPQSDLRNFKFEKRRFGNLVVKNFLSG